MSEQQLGDQHAEVSLLSACMWSKNARIKARLLVHGSDFYWPAHEAVWDAMVSLDQAGRAVDRVTLPDQVQRLAQSPAQVGAGTAALTEVLLAQAIAENITEYARIVREKAMRRLVLDAGTRLTQRALSPSVDPVTLVANAVSHLVKLRDHGNDDDTLTGLDTLMGAGEDAAPKWVIPNLLEAGDRLMLTGTEGGGKSAMIRQLAIMPAAGLHPFTEGVIPPIRSLIVDCENKPAQLRRQTGPLLRWLHDHAHIQEDPGPRVAFDSLGKRMNLLNDRDLSRVHQAIDAHDPQLVVLGPIYKMSPKALNNDDEASPFLAAVDTIIERGCAVILEAHAGKAESQVARYATKRDLRPRGSAALLGWPEFGIGLAAIGNGVADLEPWRGHREQRAWPSRVRRSAGNRWTETHPDDTGHSALADPPSEFDRIPPVPDPQGSLIG